MKGVRRTIRAAFQEDLPVRRDLPSCFRWVTICDNSCTTRLFSPSSHCPHNGTVGVTTSVAKRHHKYVFIFKQWFTFEASQQAWIKLRHSNPKTTQTHRGCNRRSGNQKKVRGNCNVCAIFAAWALMITTTTLS